MTVTARFRDHPPRAGIAAGESLASRWRARSAGWRTGTRGPTRKPALLGRASLYVGPGERPIVPIEPAGPNAPLSGNPGARRRGPVWRRRRGCGRLRREPRRSPSSRPLPRSRRRSSVEHHRARPRSGRSRRRRAGDVGRQRALGSNIEGYSRSGFVRFPDSANADSADHRDRTGCRRTGSNRRHRTNRGDARNAPSGVECGTGRSCVWVALRDSRGSARPSTARVDDAVPDFVAEVTCLLRVRASSKE